MGRSIESDSKLDLLLKKMEETEKKREESELKQSLEMKAFKAAVESWIPAVEKKVDDLRTTVVQLQLKVDSKSEEEPVDPGRGGHAPGNPPGARGNVQLGLDGHCTANLFRAGAIGFTDTQMPPPNNGKPHYQPFTPIGCNLDASALGSFANMGLSGGVAPMTCPKFDGDNLIMWRSNCEAYFDIYGVPQYNWVKMATLNFTGNAAFWL